MPSCLLGGSAVTSEARVFDCWVVKYSGLLSGFVFKSCGMIFLEVMYTRTCSEGKYYFWRYILSFVIYILY